MFLSDRAWRWGDYGYGNPWAGEYSAEQLATLTSKTTQTHTVTSVNTATVVKTVTAGGGSGAATPTQTRTTTQTAPGTAHSASHSKVPLSLAGATISLAASGSHSATSAADNTTTNASGSTISISITVSGSNPTVTLRGSGSTLQPIATGASSSTSPSGPQAMGKGEVAAITLAILFVVGLSGMLCYAWRRRKATQRSASPITQYAFSTGTATATMVSAAPQSRPTLQSISAERDAQTDAATESTAAATFQSPMGASGYDGGRAVYPLDDKSRDALFYPARTPSPRSSTAFALSFPMPPSTRPTTAATPTTTPTPISPKTIVSPPAIHAQLPSALPYSWDNPPPSSEYLPRTSVPQSMSRFLAESHLPPGEGGRGRGSYGTVASTPAYSSGVPEGAGTRPPSYSRY